MRTILPGILLERTTMPGFQEHVMSSRRKQRRAARRRLEKAWKRHPFTVWVLVLIILIAIAVGLARVWH
ncbi:MAG: hypothetical protein IBX68_11485 [Dehalococcoidia bacterium]|nr:hypothetical protein [Dehalococcoidia bacterium]